jgi:hypothetical protein
MVESMKHEFLFIEVPANEIVPVRILLNELTEVKLTELPLSKVLYMS